MWDRVLKQFCLFLRSLKPYLPPSSAFLLTLIYLVGSKGIYKKIFQSVSFRKADYRTVRAVVFPVPMSLFP